MHRLYKLLAALILLTSCGKSQTSDMRPQLSGDITKDVINLLPEGKFTADIMDSVIQSPRQAELTRKFREGIQKNWEWFAQYSKTVEPGQPMPYHPNMGITEEEFNELQRYMSNIELVSSGTASFRIENENDIIQFKANGRLKLLELVKINLKTNEVNVGKYELAFADTDNVVDDSTGLKSKWKGYTWRYEEPKDISLDALQDLQTLKAKQYKVTIGRLEKNGKTYMSIKGQEFDNGEKQVGFEIPLVF